MGWFPDPFWPTTDTVEPDSDPVTLQLPVNVDVAAILHNLGSPLRAKRWLPHLGYAGRVDKRRCRAWSGVVQRACECSGWRPLRRSGRCGVSEGKLKREGGPGPASIERW
ncbi:hypothetical protein DICA3_F22936 [Diutina catenulata]